MRVYGNEHGSVLQLGCERNVFTDPNDLRTLAANLIAAANLIEGK